MRVLYIAVLFFLTGSAFSQGSYNADLIPSAMRSRANAVVRNESVVVDMRAPDNVSKTIRKAITILNESGDEQARIIQYYNKNTSIRSIKGEVYNSSGAVIGKFTQSNFEDQSAASGAALYEEFRVKHYLPSINEYPYTVAYTIELREKQNLIIEDWMPNFSRDVAVLQSSYEFICKPGDKVRISTQNFKGEPVEVITDKQRSILWAVHDIPAEKTEAFMPLRYNSAVRVRIAPNDFVYFNKKGSYSDWESLGLWIYNDLLKNKRTLPPETVERVKQMLVGVNTDLDKARKLYAYMQQKVRYISVQVGIGGFEPFPASDVDKLGYGDCKALVNYMQSLLDVAGIPSYYCIVKSGATRVSLDPEYASMAQADHVILCIPLAEGPVWLECTSQKIPFGFLSDFTDDRNVLACTPTGGKILRTPKLTTAMNTQVRKGEFTVKKDGSFQGSIITQFKGAQYDVHEELMYSPATEQDASLKKYYNLDQISFNKISFTADKSIDPQLEEKLDIFIPRYAAVNGNKLFFKPNMFNVQRTIPDSRNRISKVYVNQGFTDEDELTFILPDGTKTDLPAGKEYKNEFGSYSTTFSRTGNKITYLRKMILNDGTYPAEAYATFFKFITDVNSSDEMRLVVEISN